MPIRMSTVPSASPACRRARSRAGVRLVSRPTRRGRSGNEGAGLGRVKPCSRSLTPAWCCSASTSVGAISAPWWPPSTAVSKAATATTVLPDPTSPCRSRCIGCGPAMSARISAIARSWAPVRVKGKAGAEAIHQLPVDLVADPGRLPLDGPLAHDQDQLEPQQLVEGQPPAGQLAVAAWSPGHGSGAWPSPGPAAPAAAATVRAADRGRTWARRRASDTQSPISQLLKPAFSDCGYTGTILPVRSPTRSTTGFVIRSRPRKRSTLPKTTTWVPSLSCLARQGWLKNVSDR